MSDRESDEDVNDENEWVICEREQENEDEDKVLDYGEVGVYSGISYDDDTVEVDKDVYQKATADDSLSENDDQISSDDEVIAEASSDDVDSGRVGMYDDLDNGNESIEVVDGVSGVRRNVARCRQDDGWKIV